MSDGVIELPVGAGGEKLDAEGLLVATINVLRQRIQLAGRGEGATDIAEGDIGAMATTQYGIGVRRITDRSLIQDFHAAQVLNNTTPNANSSNFDSSPYRYALMYLDVARANNPTSLEVILQFSEDAGVTFFDYQGDGFPMLFADINNLPKLKVFQIPIIGRLTRFRIVGNGVTASDTLTVSLSAEFVAN